MRTVDIERTAYPRMKTNLTDKDLRNAYTLSPEEIELVRDYRGDVLALAVRMKCSEHLMNHNFSLADIPQKVIDYVASQLQEFDISFETVHLINGEKIKHFFEIAKSYKSRELLDLSTERRYPILLCFIYMRIKQVTDNIVELFIRLWNQITKDAEKAQNAYVLKRDEIKQQSDELSEQLLEIIVESGSKDEIVDRIFDLYSYEEYKSLLLMVRRFKQPKTVKYYQALAARYSFVRRFIPLIWENLSFRSNTSDMTLIKAIEYLKESLDPSLPELPVKGAPTGFVPDDWDTHVFTRQRRNRKILSINKSMYELCLAEQLIDGIIAGEITVCDSQYYSAMLTNSPAFFPTLRQSDTGKL